MLVGTAAFCPARSFSEDRQLPGTEPAVGIKKPGWHKTSTSRAVRILRLWDTRRHHMRLLGREPDLLAKTGRQYQNHWNHSKHPAMLALSLLGRREKFQTQDRAGGTQNERS